MNIQLQLKEIFYHLQPTMLHSFHMGLGKFDCLGFARKSFQLFSEKNLPPKQVGALFLVVASKYPSQVKMGITKYVPAVMFDNNLH